MDEEAEGGHGVIPVKNVYYMLSYAFSALQSRGYANLGSEHFENADDLLAAVLARGISEQVKRGLKREYVEDDRTVSVPRGKINASASIKGGALMRHELVCSVDEHSENTYFNRILKTAGQKLLASAASVERKRDLRRALVYLGSVDPLSPGQIRWHHHYVRQDQTYRMLVALSRLVLTERLHDTAAGPEHLEDFGEKLMHRLYERFVLEYFRREHGKTLEARASYVPWALDDEQGELLPSMQTDVTLTPRDREVRRVLIIDTKYYTDNLQRHHGNVAVRSDHLYQVFAYVKNKEANLLREGRPKDVSGLLLYAQTDADEQPQATYQMSGNEIRVSTLNLDADFPLIRVQLDGIVQRFLA